MNSAAVWPEKLWADGQALQLRRRGGYGLAVGCEALLSKVVSIIVFVVLLLAALLGALHMTPQEAAERVRSYGESLRRDEDDDGDDMPEDFTPASAPVSEKSKRRSGRSAPVSTFHWMGRTTARSSHPPAPSSPGAARTCARRIRCCARR